MRGEKKKKRKGWEQRAAKLRKYYIISKEAIDRDVGENKTECVPSRF